MNRRKFMKAMGAWNLKLPPKTKLERTELSIHLPNGHRVWVVHKIPVDWFVWDVTLVGRISRCYCATIAEVQAEIERIAALEPEQEHG